MLLIIIQGVLTGCSQNPSPGAPAAEVDTSEILVPWHSRDGSCEHPICTPCMTADYNNSGRLLICVR